MFEYFLGKGIATNLDLQLRESFLFHITSEVHSDAKSRIVASKLRGCPSKSKFFPSHKFSHLFHPSYSRQDFKLSNDFLRHSQACILLVKKDGFTRVDEKLICSVAEGGPGMAGRAGRRWEGGDRLWSRGKVNIGIIVTIAIVIIIINKTIGHTLFPYKHHSHHQRDGFDLLDGSEPVDGGDGRTHGTGWS